MPLTTKATLAISKLALRIAGFTETRIIADVSFVTFTNTMIDTVIAAVRTPLVFAPFLRRPTGDIVTGMLARGHDYGLVVV